VGRVAQLLGDRRELVDDLLDVLEGFLRSQRPCPVATAVITNGVRRGAVVWT
jgi:hypothetical protein